MNKPKPYRIRVFSSPDPRNRCWYGTRVDRESGEVLFCSWGYPRQSMARKAAKAGKNFERRKNQKRNRKHR